MSSNGFGFKSEYTEAWMRATVEGSDILILLYYYSIY